MTDYSELVARLRHKTAVVPSDNTLCDDAADALEAQGRAIQKAALEYVTLFGELQTALERLAEAEALLLKAEQNELLLVDKLDTAEALLQRVASDVCDSFATRPEYPTLCDDIDSFLNREKP